VPFAEEHLAGAERAEVGDGGEALPSALDEAERQAVARADDDDALVAHDVLRIVDAAIESPLALAFRGHLHEAYQADRRLLLHPEGSPFSPFHDPFLDLSLLGIIPDSVAQAGDACEKEEHYSCSDDERTILKCKRKKFEVEEKCRPKEKCMIKGGQVGCY